MTITLTVAERIATVEYDTRPVGGNVYPFTIVLDAEWTGTLYLRTRFGAYYYDIPFVSTDTTVDVQFPINYPEVGIGIYSEALEICTSEARVRLRPSILEQGGSPVEFDSTLYDQWSNEVTTLLTDDDWDADSTRPLRNSVLTAWKDTVALDANVVHKTGAETIAGAKTFSTTPTVSMGTPALKLVSPTQATGGGTRASVFVRDNYGGAETDLAEDRYGYDTGGYAYRRTLLRTPDRSGTFTLEQRSYADHMEARATPYYPVDGNGNAQALDENILVTSGNIAVDPRIVHTTGVETIAGQKTFTNDLYVRKTYGYLNLYSNTDASVSAWKGNIITYDKVDGQDTELGRLSFVNNNTFNAALLRIFVPNRASQYSMEVRSYADYQTILVTPYYPVDGSNNPQALPNNYLMASGNIAVDPRLVHTTGNEVTAGIKQGDFRGYMLENPANAESGKWLRYCSIYVKDIKSRVIEAFATGGDNATAYARFIISGYAGNRLMSIDNITHPASGYKVLGARNTTQSRIEIWIYNDVAWKVPYLRFTSLYGAIPSSDITYYNTVYDTALSTGDEYAGTVYFMGSA